MVKTFKKIWYDLSAEERSYLKAGLSFIGLIGFVSIFLLPLILTRKFWSFVDYKSTSGIGDTINGISSPFIALLAAFLTFLAFYIQYKANIQQRNQFRKELRQRGQDSKAQDKVWQIERMETRFFEMVKFHRENVNEMNYTSYSRSLAQNEKHDVLEKHKAVSKKVFKEVFVDFEMLYDEIDFFFETTSIESVYNTQYLEKLIQNTLINEREIDLITYARIDIAYCIIFFGSSASGVETCKRFFEKRYLKNFYENILLFVALKPKIESRHWRRWLRFNSYTNNEKLKVFEYWKDNRAQNLDQIQRPVENSKDFLLYESVYYNNNYYKYYGGHQFRFGHYFRHLFQTVSYINDSILITFNEKYDNIKLLRGQLSTYEQLIIFLNSISSLGRIWELELRADPTKALDINQRLITKYNLIKNIPNDLVVSSVSASTFYPLVMFETSFNEQNYRERELLKMSFK